jgi:hypothetical protein
MSSQLVRMVRPGWEFLKRLPPQSVRQKTAPKWTGERGCMPRDTWFIRWHMTRICSKAGHIGPNFERCQRIPYDRPYRVEPANQAY